MIGRGRPIFETDRKDGLRAAKASLELRRRFGIVPTSAVGVFDLARKLEIDVWFADVPSLEGMYVADHSPSILIGGHRPSGRQVMTCAHEIGHHVFGHGTRVDEFLESQSQRRITKEEFLASAFATHLLMTRAAVVQGFLARGVAPGNAGPEHVYAVANWLGVGYSALLYHMSRVLKLIPRERMAVLLRTTPKMIRDMYTARLGLQTPPPGLLLAGPAWVGRAIDAQVGDLIIVPRGSAFDSQCASVRGGYLELTAPGVGRVNDPQSGWCAFVRVARRRFFGHVDYRHLEPAGDDEI